MGVTWRCKSSGGVGRNDPEQTARRPNREAALKEVGSEPVSRRTETRYEALQAGTSGLLTAKLQRPSASGVDLAVVLGTSRALPGEVSPRVRKGDVAYATEREVSRGRSRSIEASQGSHPERGWKVQRVKGRTNGRTNRP
jgi:hypothetical protein